MPSLSDLTEQLASSALIADPADLNALARLHEQLQAVPTHVSAQGDITPDLATRFTGTAGKASRIIEQIILRELADAGTAFEQVCRQIGELQQILSGAAPIASAADAAPVSSAAPAAAPPAAEPEGDTLPREEDLSLVKDFIEEAREHLTTAEQDLLKLESKPEDAELVNSIFRSFHTIKGVAGFLNLKQIGKLAHAAETLLDLARKGELVIAGGMLDLVLEALDLTKSLIEALEQGVKDQHDIAPHPRLPAILARLHVAALGKATPAPAAPASISRPDAAPDRVAAPSASAAAAAPSAFTRTAQPEEPAVSEKSAKSSSASSGESTVKVSTARLDALINMVGELVIAQAMVSQDNAKRMNEDQRVARNLSHLGKITRELQDLAMAMRMVPIQGVFQKMSRLIRDLAGKSGKEINLEIEGGETELDRNLVEAIADPLVHMVRNAADHGVEQAADREKAGKPRAGNITLRAHHQAGNIVIEITDDGRGLNKQRILQKAIAAGLVREGQEISEQDIFRLIFAPGLSTAEKITDVSGRGVGMDVVRRNVEALRGRIDITSTEGKGSTFSIRLPLTLAVIDGLVVKVGAARYILPITSIEQSLRPKTEQLSTVQNRGELCKVRENLLPIFRLHKLFAVEPKSANPCESILVLVQDGSRRCCLMVDELLGQQQVVIKSLGEAVAVQGVSGGAILGDGTISLILDVPGIMDLVAAS